MAAASIPAQASFVFGYTFDDILSDTFLSITTTDGTFDVNTFDRGWYEDDGIHDPDNLNYISCSGGDSALTCEPVRNNFFAFRLGSQFTGDILSATLNLFNPISPPAIGDGVLGTGIYTLWDVVSDTNSILGGTAGLPGFNDLASGASYGSYAFSSADNGTTIVIDLNGTALTAIADAEAGPSLFLIGGSVTASEVPEPSTLLLFSSGLALLGWIHRFRRKPSA